MATVATVVDLLSARLSDGIVDPQVIPWFLTCRAALTPPVRARLRRAAAGIALAVDRATERLNTMLRNGLAPLAAVQVIDGEWVCAWTEHGVAMRTDDLQTVVDAIGRVVALIEVAKGLELGARLALRHAISEEVTQIDWAYSEGEDGVPRTLTRLAWYATIDFLVDLRRNYDPAYRWSWRERLGLLPRRRAPVAE
jgi:hypothetical protein